MEAVLKYLVVPLTFALDCTSLDYTVLVQHFGALRIDQRLVLNDLNFIHNVFSGKIDSAKILELFSLAVPTKTRSRPVLHVPAARVDTVKNGMFCACHGMLCEKVPAADLFGSKMAFKKQAKALVSGM